MREAGHYSESLNDLLDDRLAPHAVADVRTHLASCAECRAELVRLQQGRAAVRAFGTERAVPDSLALNLTAAFDAEDAARALAREATTAAPRPGLLNRRLILLSGMAASLVLVAMLLWPRPESDRPAMAARDFDSVVAGTATFTFVTADPSALERQFSSAGAPGIRVFDLAMMGLSLEGGLLQSFGGAPSALYVYRNAAGERVVCQMYKGTTASLPATDDVRSHRDFRFYVYRVGDKTIVFWQEGAIVCVLTSRLPPEAVVQLAFEKAMRPT